MQHKKFELYETATHIRVYYVGVFYILILLTAYSTGLNSWFFITSRYRKALQRLIDIIHCISVHAEVKS